MLKLFHDDRNNLKKHEFQNQVLGFIIIIIHLFNLGIHKTYNSIK